MPKYLTKEQLGPYSVKNVKMHQSHDGYGYNCDLYRDGKKVGHCMDDGNGGEMYPIDWGKPVDYKDEVASRKWSEFRKKEQALLDAHIATLPKVPSDLPNLGDLEMDEGWFVDELINQFEEDKIERKFARDCKTKTLYKLKTDKDGRYWIHKTPYTPQIKAGLEAKHGDQLKEIINERYMT